MCLYLCICMYLCVKLLSCVQLFVTSWTVARQSRLFIEFSRLAYWSELSFPSSGNLSNPGIKPGFSHCRQILHMYTYESESLSVVSDPLWPHGMVLGILQARILEWVAFPFSRGSSQPRGQTQVSCTADWFFTSWATREAREYWSGHSIPSPADLRDPGIKPGSPAIASWATYVWVVFCRSVAKLCAWVLCIIYMVHIIQIRP